MSDTIASGTDRQFHHTVTTEADPATLWRVWADPSRWGEWDAGLRSAELDGSFVTGATGTLRPASGPPSRFTIDRVDAGVGYRFTTRMPGARLVIDRAITGAGPTTFRHEVAFDGPLAGLWSRLYGGRFRRQLPPTMEAVGRLAAETDG